MNLQTWLILDLYLLHLLLADFLSAVLMSAVSENMKSTHFAVLFETEWGVISGMPVLHWAMIWSSDAWTLSYFTSTYSSRK